MEWKIIESYFKENLNFITKHHIDSYNGFVRNKLPETIKNINISFVKNDDAGKPRHEVSVFVGGPAGDAVYLSKPVYKDGESVRPLYPNDAMVKNMYYSSDIYADVVIRYKTFHTGNVKESVHEVMFERVRIGTIPIMVNSCLCVLSDQSKKMIREMGSCPYDQGGFFIVDGKEKIIVGQERIVTNRLFVTIPNDENTLLKHAVEAQIQCTIENDPFKKTVMFYICASTNKAHPNTVMVKIPDVTEEVPITVAFRALGIESDKRILEYIVGDLDANPEIVDFLYHTIYDNKQNMYTQKDVLLYLKDFVRFKNVDHVKHIIVNDFLRNTGSNLRKKAIFLGLLVNKLVKTRLGMVPPNNRDSFTHKRLDVSGELIYHLFRDSYNNLRKHIRKSVEAIYVAGGWVTREDIQTLVKTSDIHTVFDASIIDVALKSSLKGNWGLENDPEKAGIVQDLNRVSYAGYQSHARRMNTPMSRDLKLSQPRKLDSSQWGVACPIHSPDGASIGLDKHLAVLTYVTMDMNISSLITCLTDLGSKDISFVGLGDIAKFCKVFINNDLVAVHPDPKQLVRDLRLYRRNGLISAFVSVVWNEEVFIFCQSGRLTRPLLVVNDRKILDTKNKKWNDLFNGANSKRDLDDQSYVSLTDLKLTYKDLEDRQAPLEFIDVEEAFNTLIAMYPEEIQARLLNRYTHCEIHPTTVLALYTNSIPYANHNPATRCVFSGAQGKQAIGVYSTNFNNRMDTMSYVLHYPQRPLVTTKYNVMTGNDHLPNGENLIVAIMTYTGYNQEDAIIINQNSIDSGMFNLTYFKSFIDSEETDIARGNMTMFCNPHDLSSKAINMRCKYCNIDTVDENGMPKLNAFIEEGDMMLGKLGMKISTQDGQKNVEYKDASKIADKTVEGIIDKVIVFKNENGDRNVKVRMRNFRMPSFGDKLASRHSQKGVVGMILNREDMPFTANGLIPDVIINPHAIPTRMTAAHLMECLVSKAGTCGAYIADGTCFEDHNIEMHKDILAKYGFDRTGNEVMYNGFTGEQIQTDVFIGPTYYYRLKHMVKDKINYRLHGPVSTMTRQPVRGRAIDGGLRLGEMERDVILVGGMSSFLKEAYVDKSDGFSMQNENDQIVIPYAFKLLAQEVKSLNIEMKLLHGPLPPQEKEDNDDFIMPDV